MQYYSTKLMTILTLSAAFTLSACGGGGSSTSSTPIPTTPVAVSRSVQGVAAKGIIKNGIVNIFKIAADGTKNGSTLATSRTSTVDGSYSINLGTNTGVFTVEISGDKDSSMFDEVSNQDIPMPLNMTLRTLITVESASNNTVTAHVTPFTEMIVSAASKASGGMSSANIANAQAGVTTMLGFNPLITKPIMSNSKAAADTTDMAEKLQSISLAALSKVANDTNNVLTCTGTLSEKVACVIDKTSNSIELKNTTISIPVTTQSAIRSAAEYIAANTTINKTTLSTLNGVSTFTQAKIVSSDTQLAALPATKAMFASLRNNVNAFQTALNNNSPIDALKSDLAKAQNMFDDDFYARLEMLKVGIRLAQNYADAGYIGNKVVNYKNLNNRSNNSCTLNSDKTTGKIKSVYCASQLIYGQTNLTKFQPPSETINGINYSYPATAYKTIGMATQIELLPDASNPNKFTYKTAANIGTTYFNININGSSVVISDLYWGADARANINATQVQGSIEANKTNNVISGLSISGDIPPMVGYQYLFGEPSNFVLGEKRTFKLNILSTPEAGSSNFKYVITGSAEQFSQINNAVASVGKLTILPNSFLRATPDASGDIAFNTITELQFGIEVAGIDSKMTGQLTMSNWSCDKSNTRCDPSNANFTGSISRKNSEVFNGAITVKNSGLANVDVTKKFAADNFISETLSFNGTLQANGRPPLKLSIIGVSPAFNQVNVHAQYEDGSNTLLLSFMQSDPISKKLISITSADGVSFKMIEGEDICDIFKNAIKVASFDRKKGIITYSDGSFESFK
jgi:hypothetical protein